MDNQTDNVVLTKQEYDEIVKHLEASASMSQKSTAVEDYRMIIMTRAFWDAFFSKILSSLVSVKMWVLVSVLYVPYKLVEQKLITGDNYTNIIIIVAPLVVGMREYAKNSVADDVSAPTPGTTLASTSSTSKLAVAGQDVLKTIRQRFHI